MRKWFCAGRPIEIAKNGQPQEDREIESPLTIFSTSSVIVTPNLSPFVEENHLFHRETI